jgi:hypothetical protein
MKDQILKIAKVKSEKEFYKKYPTEEAFMKAHGKAFKKAAMGAKMVNDQLHQLTDFGNPPIAQSGWHSEWEDDQYNPYNLQNIDNTINVNKELFPKGKTANKTLGKVAGGLETVEKFASAFKKAKEQAKEAKTTRQDAQVVKLQREAANSGRSELVRLEQQRQRQNQYIRPEDFILQQNQIGSSFGTGSNILSGEDGIEIQNTYAPGTLYDD